MMSDIFSDRLEQVARRAAKKAGEIQKKYYQHHFQIEKKGPVNLVTQVDLESQEAMVAIVREEFPDHTILAEENNQDKAEHTSEHIWIIDPIDGTTNFAHGYPLFCVSIAFANHNELQFGLVYSPILEEWYVAHKGKGSTLNNKKICVSQTVNISDALLATGFPYDRRTSKNNNLNLFSHFELVCRDIRRGGSAALDLAFVAAGRLDAFWEPKLQPWDIAAGVLLVQEAGGKVTDYSGQPLIDLRCGEIVASNHKLHEEIVEVTHGLGLSN